MFIIYHMHTFLVICNSVLGNNNDYFWVGAIQATDSKGAFYWVDGSRFYLGLWFSGEPNQIDQNNRQCVDLGTEEQQLKMNDFACSSSLYFLCEKGEI